MNRKFRLHYRGHISTAQPITAGVHQGGILSPFLFNVLLADLPVQDGVNFSAFADDIAVYASGVNPREVIQGLQSQLDKIVKWTTDWGQTINPEKSKAMFFSISDYIIPLLKLHNQELDYVLSQRFFGLILDSPQLTWKLHINQLQLDCKKRISLLKSISNNHWGSDRKTLLMLYKSLILSKMDYGCQFYGSAKQSLLKDL